jgi:hypothetical protein
VSALSLESHSFRWPSAITGSTMKSTLLETFLKHVTEYEGVSGSSPLHFRRRRQPTIRMNRMETELRLALRPYVTAGVALVGASVIAVTR